MKTYYQIQAAQYRANMRLWAMEFRLAIHPQNGLSFEERGQLGVMAIRGAVRMRKNAARALDYDSSKDNL